MTTNAPAITRADAQLAVAALLASAREDESAARYVHGYGPESTAKRTALAESARAKRGAARRLRAVR